ncbi:1-phosphofructokinase family hexose kinase [Enterococcus sp. 669A]|uniref:Tagatose-6-phosphate kinase n=1 Tax=Candidatus Enterococcus moelleringii TaxID=2815325 RepID=A0ABS3LGP5_9ENTE|nr:1-phosphofructokinase family hexose kinase [Enterococcus sp. 669A]MBO1308250.1 1-phosphofructokinase family hexose kinase [Enterococcus sp. 669A]
MIYTITLNPAIDRLVFLEEPLAKRKNNRAREIRYDIGGKGTHGSYAMSKLKVANLALGFAGEQNFAKFTQILAEKAISHQFLAVPDCATRESIILIDPDNLGSAMVTEPSLKVSVKEKQSLLTFLAEHLKPEDMVLVAGSQPEGFELADLKELLTVIQKAGSFLACDLSDEALQLAVELAVDFIKPNEFEIEALIDGQQTIEEKLADLAEKITCIVASRGSKGCLCYYGGNQYKVTAPKVSEINDTGAGDCFVGSFLATFYQTQDIEASLKMASACAASKVQHEDSSFFDVTEANQLIHSVEIQIEEENYAISNRKSSPS